MSRSDVSPELTDVDEETGRATSINGFDSDNMRADCRRNQIYRGVAPVVLWIGGIDGAARQQSAIEKDFPFVISCDRDDQSGSRAGPVGFEGLSKGHG